MSGSPPGKRPMSPYHLSFLFAALALLLVIYPLLEETALEAPLFSAALTAVIVSGVLVNRQDRGVFRVALLLAVVAIPLIWATLLTPSAAIEFGELILTALFCLVTAAMILLAVLREDQAPFPALAGAVCVYLLIGLTWALFYSAIECQQVDPFRFADHRRTVTGSPGHTAFSQLTYFSFVTMSGLGYGDILPRTALAETACWTESIVGQLYVAILIAGLVGTLSSVSSSGAALTRQRRDLGR